jgi:hypothetical protein
MVHHNAYHVHQEILVSMLVWLQFLARREHSQTSMVKQHVHHVVKAIILILLVTQLATSAHRVDSAVIQLFLQLNVKSVSIVKLEKFHVQHVLLVIIRLLLAQPIVIFADLVNICFSKYFFLFNNKILFIGHSCPNPDEKPIQCPPGYAQRNSGQVVCDKCPGGTYADKAGMAHCIPCPPGMYCPETTDAPLPCPTNRMARQTECHTKI